MKIIVITGGSRGIGASTALQCAKKGFGVILTYHQQPQIAQEIVRKIQATGGQAVALKLDVADTASFGAFKENIQKELETRWGRINFDVLINNAGFGFFVPIETVNEDEFDSLFRVHL